MKKAAFDPLRFIQTLVAIGERQCDGELRARDTIEATLREYAIPFLREPFSLKIPRMRSATLVADGKKIPCIGTGLVSGAIEGKDVLVSSSMPSSYFQEKANINFSPSCPTFSPGNHYFAPSVAVDHKGLAAVLKATSVRATMEVAAVPHRSANILVGNTNNPQALCFNHYDSIGSGAIDNASGVAVTMDALLRHPALLEKTLFIFAGCEELSFDRPFYWGHGYRAFEKKHAALLRAARAIYVVDSLGNGRTLITDDPAIVPRAFPIQTAKRYAKKIRIVTGDIDHLMTVYHSALDDGRGITHKELGRAMSTLVKALKKS